MIFFDRLEQLLKFLTHDACFRSSEKKSFAEATNQTTMRRVHDTSLDDLKRTFSSFDRNGDGSIETEELDLVMKSLGYQVSFKTVSYFVYRYSILKAKLTRKCV